MQERTILDILIRNLRATVNMNDPKIKSALTRASSEIAGRSVQDQRAAARLASSVGSMITRGRTHL